jgi:hypothetical protein
LPSWSPSPDPTTDSPSPDPSTLECLGQTRNDSQPRDMAVRVGEGDGDDGVEVQQGDFADLPAGLDQQADDADQRGQMRQVRMRSAAW